MYLLVGLLLAIIIILIWTRPKQCGVQSQRTWDCIDRDSGDMTTVKVKKIDDIGNKYKNPESFTTGEHSEYFTGVKNDECSPCNDENFTYAVHEFGAPNLDFKDWVTSQAVDPQVLKNHAEFVKNKIKYEDNKVIVTGRTYSPDSHDSYDPIPWSGLKRPQAVAVRSPTQVPDIDYNLYDTKPSIRYGPSLN